MREDISTFTPLCVGDIIYAKEDDYRVDGWGGSNKTLGLRFGVMYQVTSVNSFTLKVKQPTLTISGHALRNGSIYKSRFFRMI